MGKFYSLFLVFGLLFPISYVYSSVKVESLRDVSVFTHQSNPHLYYREKLQVDRVNLVGRKSVKVATISTGVNYALDILKHNIDTNIDEEPQNKIDDDKNGYIDDVIGISTYDNSNEPMDHNGHGTFMASLVGARGIGLLKRTSIVLANPFSDKGFGSWASTLESTQYAISRGARIIGMGFGGGGRSDVFYKFIEDNKEKVLFIATGGNDGKDIDQHPMYPASYGNDNLLVVASTNENDELSSFSSFGKNSVHVGAPGTSITGYDHKGNLKNLSGGSFAVALATGVAALALSANPDLSVSQLKSILIQSVDSVESLKDKISSGGRLNAYKAVQMAKELP